MIGLHVTSVYDLPRVSREELARQVDTLEAALMELEEADDSVTDSTVSVDFSTGQIEVEVFTTGRSLDDAKLRAELRIKEAVSRMMSEYITEVREERVPA